MSSEQTNFYDRHPFDWTEDYTSIELEATLAPLLARFIRRTPPDALVLEVGCGTGRVSRCVSARCRRTVGLDLSAVSVRVMSRRAQGAAVVGNCLRLPFADGCMDRVIADGVIHHTGGSFRAFAEACRVLRPAGQLYLAVYKPGGHYQKLYSFPGESIRGLVKYRFGRLVVHSTFLPVYYITHLMKSRGGRTWASAKNLFYDYFVSPVVDFIHREEVEQWCKRCDVEVTEYDPNPSLNVHSFIVRKTIC